MKGLIDNIIAIDDIDSACFNNALWRIQNRLGVTTGDVAGQFFDDLSGAWKAAAGHRLARAEIIFEYITRELSEIHDCYVFEAVQSGGIGLDKGVVLGILAPH